MCGKDNCDEDSFDFTEVEEIKETLGKYKEKLGDMFSGAFNYDSVGFSKDSVRENYETFKTKCWPSLKEKFESFGTGGQYLAEKANEALEYFETLFRKHTEGE